MLKRKIDGYLKEWKNKPSKKPLIVYGARQVGKTTSIEGFAKDHYDHVVKINFIENPEYKECFDSPSTTNILEKLSLINPSFKFIPHKTLIFLDEIQDNMNATTSLKFFGLDGRFDIICSGSALGTNLKGVSSVSSGFKEEYEMHAMDFEEFLWAKGYEAPFIDSLLDNMKDLRPLDNFTFTLLNKEFVDFMNVGGYPRILCDFLDNKNFSSVLTLQKEQLKDYRDDITKYLPFYEAAKALRVLDSLPTQLGKENHKFQFSKLPHGARFKDYFSVVEWIKNAGVILQIHNLNLIQSPLYGNSEPDNFRVYFSDIGLLLAMIKSDSSYVVGDSKNTRYSGAIYESVIAQSLHKQGIKPYFYRSEDSTIELDFLFEHNLDIYALEVKAKSGRQISLSTFLNKNNSIKKAIKFSSQNIGYENGIYTFPLFLCFLLKRYLS